jgi:mannonate dehydratase
MQLTELLTSRSDERLRALVAQAGVADVIGLMSGAEQDQRMFASVGAEGAPGEGASDAAPWSEASLARIQEDFARSGFALRGFEDTPPLDLVRLGLPGRDEQLEHLIIQIRAMGRLGIPLLCYNWMALSSWARTSIAVPARGGALVTGFRLDDGAALPPIAGASDVDDDQLWEALAYFLAAVVPEAESAGVRLAMHPDDPPLSSVRGIPRIMSSLDGFRRLLSMAASPANALTLCQGNFALMTPDLPAVIREFGSRGVIAFVHFRDVRGTAGDFVETFHDDGPTDMAACLRAYDEVGFTGPIRPDHVPTMYGESNAAPGYETLGRLFALGYIRGLQDMLR